MDDSLGGTVSKDFVIITALVECSTLKIKVVESIFLFIIMMYSAHRITQQQQQQQQQNNNDNNDNNNNNMWTTKVLSDSLTYHVSS